MIYINLYGTGHLQSPLKPVVFLDDARDALRQFPETARNRAGRELKVIQRGGDPSDWKPMTSVGAGVREIRIRYQNGIFRVIYATKMGKKIYVLHCFQKKSQRTSLADLRWAQQGYRELAQEYAQ